MAASTPHSKKVKIDFLNHVEGYLAKRDGVVDLLDIAMYASNFLLATSAFPKYTTAHDRLESFSSSLALSIKALHLGKFIEEANKLRTLYSNSKEKHVDKRRVILSVMSHGGAGLDFFMKQFVWLALSGLIDHKRSSTFNKIRYWGQLIGSIGYMILSVWDLWEVNEEEPQTQISNEGQRKEAEKKAAELHEKMVTLEISFAMSLLDAMVALADIRGGKGFFGHPLLRASKGLLRHALGAHKFWKSTEVL